MGFDKKEYNRMYLKQWRLKNKEKISEQNKRYRKEHAEYFKEYLKEYRKSNPNLKSNNNYSKKSRASNLLYSYNRSDMQYNRGVGDLTSDWIAENILTKPCAHCGETDWRKIGCNRLDNSKPHTKDNVEPCCRKCNLSLKRKS